MSVYVNPETILLALQLLYLMLSSLGLASMGSQLRYKRVMEHVGHMPESMCICMLHKPALQAGMLSWSVDTREPCLLCKSAHCCTQSGCR